MNHSDLQYVLELTRPLFLALLISFSIQANKSWIRARMLADQALYLHGTSVAVGPQSRDRLHAAGLSVTVVDCQRLK